MTLQTLSKMKVSQLKALFEVTENQEMTVQLATVRGWLMDALYEKLGDEEADKYFGI